jgi:hypothetical protein
VVGTRRPTVDPVQGRSTPPYSQNVVLTRPLKTLSRCPPPALKTAAKGAWACRVGNRFCLENPNKPKNSFGAVGGLYNGGGSPDGAAGQG